MTVRRCGGVWVTATRIFDAKSGPRPSRAGLVRRPIVDPCSEYQSHDSSLLPSSDEWKSCPFRGKSIRCPIAPTLGFQRDVDSLLNNESHCRRTCIAGSWTGDLDALDLQPVNGRRFHPYCIQSQVHRATGSGSSTPREFDTEFCVRRVAAPVGDFDSGDLPVPDSGLSRGLSIGPSCGSLAGRRTLGRGFEALLLGLREHGRHQDQTR